MAVMEVEKGGCGLEKKGGKDEIDFCYFCGFFVEKK